MNFFQLSKVRLTRQKKGMKIVIFIYTLAVILVVLSVMVSLTLAGHLSAVYKTDFMYRTIGISYHPDYNTEHSPDEINQWLSSMPHVDSITHFTPSQALYIQDMKENPAWVGGTFEGTPLYPGAPVVVTAGRAPLGGEQNVALVPSLLGSYYLDSEGSLLRENFDLIKGKSLLGTTLELGYGDGEHKESYTCRVIGVYDSFSMGMDPYQIILSQGDLDKINTDMGNPTNPTPYILVDSLENVPAVETAIEQMGFFHNRIKTPGRITEVSNSILCFGLLAGTTALLIGAVSVGITAAGAIRERTREIGVLKAIGYQNRHIRRIVLLENLRSCLFALLIAFLVCGSLLFGVWYILRQFLNALFIGLAFSFPVFLLIFVCAGMVITLISLLSGLFAAMWAYDISPAVSIRDEET